jgi:putative addiction module killer protein
MTKQEDDRIDKAPPVLYKGQAVTILQTPVFQEWLASLRDRQARLRIDDRIKRLAAGNPGDTKPVGDKVHELRLKFGPGYRIYYLWRRDTLIILLFGGDKGSQVRDILRAKNIAAEIDNADETGAL